LTLTPRQENGDAPPRRRGARTGRPRTCPRGCHGRPSMLRATDTPALPSLSLAALKAKLSLAHARPEPQPPAMAAA